MDLPSSSSPATDQSAGRSRLLVLMFTDLVGSTGIKDTLKTPAFVPLLRRHDALLRQAVGGSSGRIQQDMGDGGFAVFATSSDAVTAALQFQWLMNAEPWPPGQRLFSRIGIHLGEVAEMEGQQDGGNKLVGMAIDLAARVMSLAQGGQILLTRVAFNDARQFITTHPGGASVTVKWVAHGPYLVKGIDEPLDVFEVGVEGQAPLTPPPDSEKVRRALRPGEELTLGWRPGINLPMPGAPLWIVEKKLGEGGFGEVWLARHAKTKSVRIFKFCFDADRLRALKREVVLFRLLKESLGDRRDISRVIDWRFDDPPYYIEMEFVPGGNLTDWAAGRGGIDKIPLPDRLRIVAQVATALSAAHSVGILHKDIKPSNIMMAQTDAGAVYPRLTDFGIGILTDRARLKDFNITEAGFTAGNLTMNDSSRTGTRMYAPPETLADKPHTVQGDIYALGILFYQLVVGDLNRPFGVGWERDVADKILRQDMTACLDVDPARRLLSAADLAERLGRRYHHIQEALRESPPVIAGQSLSAPSAGRVKSVAQAIASAERHDHRKPASGSHGRQNKRVAISLIAASSFILALASWLVATRWHPWRAPGIAPSPAVLAPISPLSGPANADIPKSFTNTLGIRFVRIEPGEFMMGSPVSEEGRSVDETPHRVKLTEAFMMACTPVSQSQWKQVMGVNPSQFHGDDLPVDAISWDAAAAFCKKLGEKEGKKYRLPTEAEWEYACRAGTTTAYNTGDGEAALKETDWYAANSDSRTHPVGQKKPNAWGLYDMQGNVLQWCSDYSGDYPTADAIDPTGPPAGNDDAAHVLRGGSWNNMPQYCRAAYRDSGAPDGQFNNVGFRLCLDLNPR